MAYAGNQDTIIVYTGNSAQRSFDVTFTVSSKADLGVWVDGVYKFAEYNVSANSAGDIQRIIFLSAETPVSNSIVVINRDSQPTTQTTYPSTNWGIPLNDEFTNIYKKLDELEDRTNKRAIRLADSSPTHTALDTAILGAPSSGKFIVVNSDNTKLVWSSVSHTDVLDAASAAAVHATSAETAALFAESQANLALDTTNEAINIISVEANFWLNQFETAKGSGVYNALFSTGDWISEGSSWLLEIPKSSHDQGNNAIVQIFDSNSKEVDVESVIVVSATLTSAGDVKLYVPQSPDLRFTGRVTILNGMATLDVFDRDLVNNTDSNTKIEVSAVDNNILFTTASNERMRITNTGNVGINVTNPTFKLEVNGGAKFGDGITVSAVGTDGSYYTLMGKLRTDASAAVVIGFENTKSSASNTYFGARRDGGIIFRGSQIEMSTNTGFNVLTSGFAWKGGIYEWGWQVAGTAGNFILPNGAGTAGQVMQSNGNGNAATWIDAPGNNTSNVLAATAGAAAGDIGTYAYAAQLSPNQAVVEFGGTVAGSSLRPSGIQNNTDTGGTDTGSRNGSKPGATGLTGTWRCMGRVTKDREVSNTLWLRIS